MSKEIKEFHLFAGIGGGIYGGKMLNHTCCGAVEIDGFCQSVLKMRQEEGAIDRFEIYDDITKISGERFKGDLIYYAVASRVKRLVTPPEVGTYPRRTCGGKCTALPWRAKPQLSLPKM